jgi:hypothetical protein
MRRRLRKSETADVAGSGSGNRTDAVRTAGGPLRQSPSASGREVATIRSQVAARRYA